MFSTPSDEDIAKILASLQAQAIATQPLESTKKPATVFFEERKEEITRQAVKTTGGATTIFFEDDDFSFQPSLKVDTAPSKAVEITTEERGTRIAQNEIDTEKPSTDNENTEPECTEGHQIVPTIAYTTLTYLTTFYIPLEESTSTSVKSNVVVSSQNSLQTIVCNIKASNVVETTTEPTIAPATEPLPTTTDQITTADKEETLTTTLGNKTDEEETTTSQDTTLPQEITTETRYVTESNPEVTEAITEEGDEVDLLFKTLYTTYTYLTTYFQDSTSSVDSGIDRTVVLQM
ncbi:unnamed protein product [Ceutorhynchus assimilis]|uniref:Uncharacterized protein n=1 Tax=Ceutorhynchus assimilis TaxID=467358 RepID=A0A9N9MXX9_9CUCU|nr:unnamed protein product [Ceutorhynchus assimilis]